MRTDTRLLLMSILCAAQFACSGSAERPVSSMQKKIKIDKGAMLQDREQAMAYYRDYLEHSSTTHPNYNDALTRLADLEMVAADKKLVSQPDISFYQARKSIVSADAGGEKVSYQNAIKLYQDLLKKDTNAERRVTVLYNLARAQEQLGELEQAIKTLTQLNREFPRNEFSAESWFRIGEMYFSIFEFEQSIKAYQQAIRYAGTGDYFRRSLYKQGWAELRLEKTDRALTAFLQLLASFKLVQLPNGDIDRSRMGRIDSELMDDVFRSVNIALSYSTDKSLLHRQSAATSNSHLEYMLLRNYGRFLVEKERKLDAVDMYSRYIDRHGNGYGSASLSLELIAMQQQANRLQDANSSKEEFLRAFGPGSVAWQKYSANQQARLEPEAFKFASEVSRYWHAFWQQTKTSAARKQALNWYRYTASSFAARKGIDELVFLLAELEFESGQYKDSAEHYRRVAYDLHNGSRAPEAAYALLLSVERQLKRKPGNPELTRQLHQFGQLFIERFPDHEKVVVVERRTLESMYSNREYDRARQLAAMVLARRSNASNSDLVANRLSAQLITAHIAYDEKDYVQAERLYSEVMPKLDRNGKQGRQVAKRLANAVYQVGRAALQAGNSVGAADKLVRAAELDRSGKLGPLAYYDAAAAYISAKEWQKAEQQLAVFIKRWPKHDLHVEAYRKLVHVQMEQANFAAAIKSWQWLASNDKKSSDRFDALTQVVELAKKLNQSDEMIAAYKKIISFPSVSHGTAMEARQSLVDIYRSSSQSAKAKYWLQQLVRAEKRNPKKSTPRTLTLAAMAQLDIARGWQKEFEGISLRLPLKKSLRKKKTALKKALAAFDAAGKYNVQDAVTASTFAVASMYQSFGKDLMRSQRPQRLKGEELEMYNLMLEEQAYPFEEKAIAAYEANVHRSRQGVFDQWVQKSYERLAAMEPAKYNRLEEVAGYF